ncbi:MAG: sn-glycerol-3-phosphate ABC transporter ATP-binding protein UgpC [Paracoccaceae bacterium]|nr:sn-glycerol-3-phosphate ABC transporter ATP-binding protein UgpC [Paracoccaceae bacterium]
MASVELKDIRKSFGNVEVIRDVNLKIAEGEFVVLVGPSGCGKSTLLRCIAGLEPVTSGRLMLDGVDQTDADPITRGVAMVFQSYALYPHMSVAENIGFGLKIAGESKAAIKTRVLEIAKFLKLETLLNRKPKELSGGQRQRVAIGRALARKPGIFLFDEPLSNLDASLRAEMRVELAKLHADLGNTMIYVTHDQVEAMTLADRMVILNGGLVEQEGPPLDLFNRPTNKFVAGFLGQPPMNFIRVKDVKRDGRKLPMELPGGGKLEVSGDWGNMSGLTDLELGIRPEDVSVASGANGLPMEIDLVEHLGDETILYGHLDGGQSMTVRLAGQSDYKVGQKLRLDLSLDRLLVFDLEGRNANLEHR